MGDKVLSNADRSALFGLLLDCRSIWDKGANVATPAITLAYVIEDRGGGTSVEWSDQPVAITAGEVVRLRQGSGGNAVVGTRRCGQWLTD